jgi:hypothetical protein
MKKLRFILIIVLGVAGAIGILTDEYWMTITSSIALVAFILLTVIIDEDDV